MGFKSTSLHSTCFFSGPKWTGPRDMFPASIFFNYMSYFCSHRKLHFYQSQKSKSLSQYLIACCCQHKTSKGAPSLPWRFERAAEEYMCPDNFLPSGMALPPCRHASRYFIQIGQDPSNVCFYLHCGILKVFGVCGIHFTRLFIKTLMKCSIIGCI